MKTRVRAAKLSRLRRWRLKQGLMLQEVADLTGYTEGYISLLETGQRQLRPTDRVKFARNVGARVADLFDVEPAGEEPA